jgi:hypothetical protein
MTSRVPVVEMLHHSSWFDAHVGYDTAQKLAIVVCGTCGIGKFRSTQTLGYKNFW